MKSLLFAAALALAASTAAAQSLPDWAHGKTGVWTVESASEGGEVCTLNLTSEGAIGGLAVEVSAGCRQNYDFEDVAAWTMSGDNSLRLIDPTRKTVWSFHPATDGVWVSDERGGQQLALSPGDYWQRRSSTLQALMTGTFSLSGPNHANACGFWLTRNKSGSAGTLKQSGACPAKWKAKRWAKWSLKAKALVLADAKGAPVLTLTHAGGVTFVAATDPDLFFGPGTIQGN